MPEHPQVGVSDISTRSLPNSLIGRHLGDFAIREKIGAGGFGAIYRAEQTLLDREAVIKVLQAEVRTEPALVQRFLREARLATSSTTPTRPMSMH
jgi:serine/threonine protein kinase